MILICRPSRISTLTHSPLACLLLHRPKQFWFLSHDWAQPQLRSSQLLSRLDYGRIRQCCHARRVDAGPLWWKDWQQEKQRINSPGQSRNHTVHCTARVSDWLWDGVGDFWATGKQWFGRFDIIRKLPCRLVAFQTTQYHFVWFINKFCKIYLHLALIRDFIAQSSSIWRIFLSLIMVAIIFFLIILNETHACLLWHKKLKSYYLKVS